MSVPLLVTPPLFFPCSLPPPPPSPLFPYTTLFRSRLAPGQRPHQRGPQRIDQILTPRPATGDQHQDRKSTRLNSSHVAISYAVFCLKKKKKKKHKRYSYNDSTTRHTHTLRVLHILL